jgi:hypothetical protein
MLSFKNVNKIETKSGKCSQEKTINKTQTIAG